MTRQTVRDLIEYLMDGDGCEGMSKEERLDMPVCVCTVSEPNTVIFSTYKGNSGEMVIDVGNH